MLATMDDAAWKACLTTKLRKGFIKLSAFTGDVMNPFSVDLETQGLVLNVPPFRLYVGSSHFAPGSVPPDGETAMQRL